jgi:cellulose 1,4-beta-cellobiosidase
MAYNGAVAAGGSIAFGFQAAYSGTNALPQSITLNGVACTIN